MSLLSAMPRRSSLGVLGSLALPRPASAANIHQDFSRPAMITKALLKILGSTDPKQTVVSFAAGRVYGCIDKEPPVPLFGTHSVATARAKVIDENTFILRQHIIGFRTAFGTEDVIDSMRNPVTNEVVELPLTDYGVGDTLYSAEGVFALRKGERIQMGTAGPRNWSQDGDVLAIQDDSILRTPGPIHPKVDVVTRYAEIRDITNARVTSARSWLNFSAVDPFRPWLKMRQPGFQLWHVAGRKVPDMDSLPDYIKRFVIQRFPRLMEIPPIDA
jgi:hypothetical protein